MQISRAMVHSLAGRLGGLLLLAGCLGTAAVAATQPRQAGEARGPAIHTYDLGDLTASVFAGGALVLSDAAGIRVLTVRLGAPAPARHEPPFAAVFVEGEPRGRRGFDEDADDDGDGLIDEDPANGRDDDGDGLRDEDFAAIGEAMAVVDLATPGGRFHQETYHWSYPHLKRGLAMSLCLTAGAAGPGSGTVVVAAAAGDWRLADLSVSGEVSDRSEAAVPAFVLRVPRAGGQEPLWLGISPLAPGPGDGRRPLAAGARLELPLSGPLELAVAAAPSRLQLRRQLAALHLVRLGVCDAAGGRVPWTVSPLCRACLAGEHPAASWSQDEGGWNLSLHVRPGQDALIDPDRLRAGGSRLPSPDRIEWRPDADPGAQPARTGWSVLWSAPAEGLAAEDLLPDLYENSPELLRHAGRGTLRLSYLGEPPWRRRPAAQRLTGENLIGRPFDLPLPPGRSDAGLLLGREGAGSAIAGRAGARGIVQLAPDLLRNYPNPFVDRTRFSYVVPATFGEAFPADAASLVGDPSAPLSRSGSPSLVSLKIYSLSGAEVSELQGGYLAPGVYEVSWDGSDRFGHPVAAGTYFCKLQIEGWSVTKRVVVLR